MRNKLFVVFLFAFALGFSQCCSLTDTDFRSDSSCRGTNVRRQYPLTRSGGDIYNVTAEDIKAYIHFKTLENEKDTLVLKSIIPFPSDDNPSCYVINYEDSWEMISSDKRTAAVIATGEGEFNPDFETNKSIAWLSCLAEEIRVLKTTDKETKNSDKYQMFWKLITADKSLFKSDGLITRSGPDTLDHPVPGHYELYDVEVNEITVSFKDHLIHTKWGQGVYDELENINNSQQYPYNKYCPKDSSYHSIYQQLPGIFPDSYDDFFPLCYAGCVAVAGGQIVKYYRDLGNDGAEPYRYASCATREYPNTNYSAMLQWNKSFSNWTYFNGADSSDMAAVMLANIGKGCQMHYKGRYILIQNQWYSQTIVSNVPLINLQSVLLNEYQTDSFFFVFDSSSINLYNYIEELLSNDYPSIVDAGINDSTNRHAFIIDRYKKEYTQYNYYYRFIPDDPNLSPNMFEETVYCQNTPSITYFGMNWGQYGFGDDIWCIKSGDWYDGSVHYLRKVYLMTFDAQGGYPPCPGGQSINGPTC